MEIRKSTEILAGAEDKRHMWFTFTCTTVGILGSITMLGMLIYWGFFILPH